MCICKAEQQFFITRGSGPARVEWWVGGESQNPSQEAVCVRALKRFLK